MQGSFRQTLLDLLKCTGVEVQKNMHLPVITHIIAVDVHDQKSAKLNAARRWDCHVSCWQPLSPPVPPFSLAPDTP